MHMALFTAALNCSDLVYAEIKKRTKDALLRLIEREREGELVDRALIKNILGIFIEVGEGEGEGEGGGSAGGCS